MARLQGRCGTIEISLDAECTWCNIGCTTDIGFSTSLDEIEVTCRDDGPFRSYLQGRKEAELTIDGYLDCDDIGQEKLRIAIAESISPSFRYRPAGSQSGGLEFIGRGTITSFDITSELDGGITFSATIRLSGQFASTYQPLLGL